MNRKGLILIGVLVILGGSTLMGKTTILTWMTDMYNQQGLKPQEEGSMTSFPIGSVTTKGHLYESYDARFDWLLREMDPNSATKNPVSSNEASVANGEFKYKTYCAVCHGFKKEYNEQGYPKKPVNEKGMVAPLMTDLTPNFTDGYIYHKAKYGGAVMPPLGFATTSKDRWDIVNFIRTLEKKHDQE